MRKINFILAWTLIISSSNTYAVIVFDPSVFMQVAATATNTLSQLENIKQQSMMLNGSQYQWSNAQSLINQLGEIAQQNNALAYSAKNMDTQFKQTFPGYQAPQDYGQQYQTITDRTQSTLNNVLHSAGTNAQDFQDENRRLTFLQQQSQSADNQLKAIHAANQIASEQVTQTQLLRQTVIAQTNAQTTYYAAQTQKEASARAELVKVINQGSQSVPQIGQSGNALMIPDINP